MDYSHPELANRLAADYTLGTLRGAARRRMQALLPAHPSLQHAVRTWEARLMPLADAVVPVVPRRQTWQQLQARLNARLGLVPPAPWWQRLLPWQLGTGAAGLSSLVLTWALLQPTPELPPPVLVVLDPQASAQVPAELLTQARFVASISGDGRALVLRPLASLPVQAGRALELWAVPTQGAPRSLGLIAADQPTSQMRQAGLLRGTSALAVSVEPSGGSPTGAPTGPVIAIGSI